MGKWFIIFLIESFLNLQKMLFCVGQRLTSAHAEESPPTTKSRLKKVPEKEGNHSETKRPLRCVTWRTRQQWQGVNPQTLSKGSGETVRPGRCKLKKRLVKC